MTRHDASSAAAAALPPLTIAQRNVVLSDDLRLLVGAGAGSGKTSTVVQKLCYLLGGRVRDVDDVEYVHPSPISLHDIAAITFTNEAAADLKRKLRRALAACGLRHLAIDVDAARIGTIHGFCSDLLGEFALRAGMPASLRVLSEGESAVLSHDCAREAMQWAAENHDLEGFDELLAGRSLNQVVQLVREVAVDADRLQLWQRNARTTPPMFRAHERALLSLAARARDARHAELAQLHAMDFDRMIVAVRDLLHTDAHVRHAVQRQIRLLIVDEFQDVDPAQKELTFLLGGRTHNDPSPSRIMLVGDPKQSIYRFRRADVSVWNAVSSEFSDDSVGRRLELSDNFRSDAAILAFVDAVVGTRLDEPVSAERGRQPFEVDYRSLNATRKPSDDGPSVELIAIAAQDDGRMRSAADVRDIEAEQIARRIRELRERGESLGNMAMLFSAMTDVQRYIDALRRHHIPAYVLRTDGFWETREVLDCVLALRAIRDPRDDVALVGFLRGPFVGVRDDTLVALRQAVRNAPNAPGLVDALADSTLETERCAHAASVLATYTALRDRIPTHALLERLISESGFLLSLQHDASRGLQAVANIRKLLRLSAATPEQSLGEFLREVQDARGRVERVGEERLYRERADVVTITSIHSAKGLEWPIVFWCDLSRSARLNSAALLCGRDRFRLRAEGDDDTDEQGKDIEYDLLKGELAEEDAAEALRKWYVATTRPQRLLIASGVPLGTPSKKSASPASALRATFPALLDVVTPGLVEYQGADGNAYRFAVHIASPMVVGADISDTPEAGDGSRAGVAEQASSRSVAQVVDISHACAPSLVPAPRGRTRLSATQLLTFAHDAQQWRQRYMLGFEPEYRAPLRVESGRNANLRPSGTPAAMGTVVHAVLEQVDAAHILAARFGFEQLDLDALIEAGIERGDPDAAAVGSDDGRRYRGWVKSQVEQTVNSEAWRSAVSLPSARRELTYVRLLPDGTSIEGAIDLIAMQNGVAQILDLKTGSERDAQRLSDRYRVQAAVYLDAVRALSGQDARFMLLRTEDGSAVPVDADNVDVMRLISQLRG